MSTLHNPPPGSSSIKTWNKQGRTTSILNEINEAFVAFSRTSTLPVLDLGCAFGIASLAALQQGAIVFANDIDEGHLNTLIENTPILTRENLRTILGRFPFELEFPEESIGAVHASNLFNFLSGNDLEIGARKIWKWLRPGGKVFVISGTPYARNIRGFIPEYEKRLANGERWPGQCEDLRKYSNDPTIDELPRELHLLDDHILRRTFGEAGFAIEEARMFHRRGTPDYISLDGRENVLLIASKY